MPTTVQTTLSVDLVDRIRLECRMGYSGGGGGFGSTTEHHAGPINAIDQTDAGFLKVRSITK